MRFDLALLFSALATTATSRVIGGLDSVKADSTAGRALMSKARRLNDEEDVDYSWLPGYSFKFEKCYSWDAFGREEQNRQESYVVFRACPQGSCSSSCRHGAEYIVEMREYVEAYTQAKQNLQEYNCQQVDIILLAMMTKLMMILAYQTVTLRLDLTIARTMRMVTTTIIIKIIMRTCLKSMANVRS